MIIVGDDLRVVPSLYKRKAKTLDARSGSGMTEEGVGDDSRKTVVGGGGRGVTFLSMV